MTPIVFTQLVASWWVFSDESVGIEEEITLSVVCMLLNNIVQI
jgi:hypothetical protein